MAALVTSNGINRSLLWWRRLIADNARSRKRPLWARNTDGMRSTESSASLTYPVQTNDRRLSCLVWSLVRLVPSLERASGKLWSWNRVSGCVELPHCVLNVNGGDVVQHRSGHTVTPPRPLRLSYTDIHAEGATWMLLLSSSASFK